MEHLGYLFAAYSIIFVLIGLYAIFIGRRQSNLEREVGKLETSLRQAEDSLAGGDGHTEER
jgi:CcmD family protein